jgi:hypothetical protein
VSRISFEEGYMQARRVKVKCDNVARRATVSPLTGGRLKTQLLVRLTSGCRSCQLSHAIGFGVFCL